MQGDIANQRYNIDANTLNAQQGLINQQNENMNQATQFGANQSQQQGQNVSNAISQQGNFVGLGGDATNQALNAQSNIAQGLLGNWNQLIGTQGNLTGAQMDLLNGALNAGVGITNQNMNNNQAMLNAILSSDNNRLTNWSNALLNGHVNTYDRMMQNYLNANAQNSNIYQNGIANATSPITASAGAQEAAQQPAINMWQMSMGLSPAQNGTIAALAGQGTHTQTTSNGGGGFLSGMAAPIAMGLGTGLGQGLAGAAAGIFCFPAGTKISMKNGIKNIEAVEVGDEIENPMKAGELKVLRKMRPHWSKIYKVRTDLGYEVKTTETQPILTDRGEFVALERLREGDGLAKVGRIKRIEYSGEDFVYDIEANGENVYIANGFIVEGGGYKYWKE